MRRAESSNCPVPSRNCGAIRGFYQTEAKFKEFKEKRLNIDSLGNYIRSSLASDLKSNDPAAGQRVQKHYDQLQLLEANVQNMSKCIQSDIIERQCHASKIYGLQEEIEKIKKELSENVQVAKDAKERADLLRDPYSKTTRWQLWFPIGRPLQKESIPVLLSIAIVLLVVSLALFMRLANLQIGFQRISNIQEGGGNIFSIKLPFMKYH